MVTPTYLVLSTVNPAMNFVLGVYYVFTFIGYSKYLTFLRVKIHKPFSFPLLLNVQNIVKDDAIILRMYFSVEQAVIGKQTDVR